MIYITVFSRLYNTYESKTDIEIPLPDAAHLR